MNSRPRISEKIKTVEQLRRIAEALRKRGKKIVFTNGCFDILHYGHVKYLEDASRLANILVVAVNSDSSARKIKGKGRPVNKLFSRIRIVGALSPVDYVTSFAQETPLKLIKIIKPDLLVKGGDWKEGQVIGGDFVKKHGGEVIVIGYSKGYSTTGLLRKIADGK